MFPPLYSKEEHRSHQYNSKYNAMKTISPRSIIVNLLMWILFLIKQSRFAV